MDQNFFADIATRYLGLVPCSCELLLGTNYMLLRPEFTEKSRSARQRSGYVRRIHIFFGGSDPTNQTRNVLLALDKLRLRGIEVDVVIGSSNPHRLQLQEMCESMPNVVLHCQVFNMAELIDRADLGIGAGGVAMWERCYLGLPTITVVFAENQVRTTEDVGRVGAIKYLGRCTTFTTDEYENAIKETMESPEELRRMAEISRELVRPGTQKVADIMERISRTY
jgi:UDP-2,4-diacetamido-2,4,6-trideoxy-beta-L-altropyranose hydrolase